MSRFGACKNRAFAQFRSIVLVTRRWIPSTRSAGQRLTVITQDLNVGTPKLDASLVTQEHNFNENAALENSAVRLEQFEIPIVRRLAILKIANHGFPVRTPAFLIDFFLDADPHFALLQDRFAVGFAVAVRNHFRHVDHVHAEAAFGFAVQCLDCGVLFFTDFSLSLPINDDA